jgi:hypothetical protein
MLLLFHSRSSCNISLNHFFSSLVSQPVSWTAVFALALTGGAIVAYYNVEKERRQEAETKKVQSVGVAKLGGPFTLVDTEGQVVTSKQFQGKVKTVAAPLPRRETLQFRTL